MDENEQREAWTRNYERRQSARRYSTDRRTNPTRSTTPIHARWWFEPIMAAGLILAVMGGCEWIVELTT